MTVAEFEHKTLKLSTSDNTRTHHGRQKSHSKGNIERDTGKTRGKQSMKKINSTLKKEGEIE